MAILYHKDPPLPTVSRQSLRNRRTLLKASPAVYSTAIAWQVSEPY